MSPVAPFSRVAKPSIARTFLMSRGVNVGLARRSLLVRVAGRILMRDKGQIRPQRSWAQWIWGESVLAGGITKSLNMFVVQEQSLRLDAESVGRRAFDDQSVGFFGDANFLIPAHVEPCSNRSQNFLISRANPGLYRLIHRQRPFVIIDVLRRSRSIRSRSRGSSVDSTIARCAIGCSFDGQTPMQSFHPCWIAVSRSPIFWSSATAHLMSASRRCAQWRTIVLRLYRYCVETNIGTIPASSGREQMRRSHPRMEPPVERLTLPNAEAAGRVSKWRVARDAFLRPQSYRKAAYFPAPLRTIRLRLTGSKSMANRSWSVSTQVLNGQLLDH